MKYLLPIVAIVMLTACKGRAENANAETELEMIDSVATCQDVASTGIPVGVQVLGEGMSYNIDSKPGHLVVLDFNATWCGPCIQFAPIFEEAAQKYAGQVEFISVDVDTHQELVQQLGITSIPFIVFQQPDGSLNSWVGFLPKAEFFKAIDELK